MDDEISFGEIRQSQPDRGIAPDRNPHFAVAWVGEPGASPIVFVDLDVMRELESHALENVSVELGGVLLGRQSIDDLGRPYIAITDSLRAEHYEATRGSFKFTHQTWEAISRERDRFPDKVAIVGWYHTHPGWGVFLSDMDLFICNHFFSQSLDVALVIDPLRDERGWFGWSQAEKTPQKKRLEGFALFAHRHRAEELAAVADRYNEREDMTSDPRTRFSRPTAPPPSVTFLERPASTAAWVAVGALIVGQWMLLAAMYWRSPMTAVATPTEGPAAPVELLVRERQAQAKSDAYREMLRAAIEKSPGSVGWVDRLDALNEQVSLLSNTVDGQSALARELRQQLATSSGQLASLTLENKKLIDSMAQAEARTKELQARIGAASSPTSTLRDAPAWMMIVGAVLLALVMAAGGLLAGWSLALHRTGSGLRRSGNADGNLADSTDGAGIRSA